MQENLWIPYILERMPELWQRLGEHLFLTGMSTVTAVLMGVPLGLLAFYRPRLRGPLLGVVSILQTIPSLAMLVILLALFQKIGVLPAIVALILYALLPIVRNTLAGLQGVTAETIEAARGIGMTEWQQMRLVRIPLAVPVIMAGIRTAAVMAVGIATLAAFIGAGGLGEFINRGLALSNTRLIFLGAIPAALLALLVDFALGTVERAFDPKRNRTLSRRARFALKLSAVVIPLGLLVPVIVSFFPSAHLTSGPATLEGRTSQGVVRIASKNFTEQHILAEMMAQLIESRTSLTVERKFNLGGTIICHQALARGQVDLYAEYTGTGLMAILDLPLMTDPAKVYQRVAEEYRNRFNLIWMEPFGFNNTYTLTVRKSDALRNQWKAISDLAPLSSGFLAGFSGEFQERPDGYPGFQQVYGFQFGQVHDLDPSLTYQAIAKGAVDVIDGYATDGRIPAYNLVSLIDDKKFFPPYHAAPVIRQEILDVHPGLRKALTPLGSLIDNGTMMRLNYEVDEKKRAVSEVVREFLHSKKIM
jgi:osmoprotectant transport system permease protein